MHRTHYGATGRTVESHSTDSIFCNATKSDSGHPATFLELSNVD
jgi:uncharacterized Zn-finger protein